MFKKKFATKGKGKKIIPQEILEFLKVMTMVNYEVMTSKRDFDDLLEGIDRRCSSRRLDLSLQSRRPSSFQLDFSFRGLGRLSSFDSTKSHQPLSSLGKICFWFERKDHWNSMRRQCISHGLL
jgi:hypothetical protein